MAEADMLAEPGERNRAERWAEYVVDRASGGSWALGLVALAAAFYVVSDVWGDGHLPGLSTFLLAMAFMYWERGGFKRLLARRDSQIERLRSHEHSA